MHFLTLNWSLTFGMFDLMSSDCLELDLLLALADAGSCP